MSETSAAGGAGVGGGRLGRFAAVGVDRGLDLLRNCVLEERAAAGFPSCRSMSRPMKALPSLF